MNFGGNEEKFHIKIVSEKYGGNTVLKIKEFFRKLEGNRKWQVSVFLILEVIVLGMYFFGGKWAKEESRKNAVIRQPIVLDYSDMIYEIENIVVEHDKVTFSGWAFHLDATNEEVVLILEDEEGIDQYIYASELWEREDIEKYFIEDREFGKVGFRCSTEINAIENDCCYKVLLGLCYQKDSEIGITTITKIDTGYFFYEGDIFAYNPKEFTEPQIKVTKLLNIIKEGKLRAYDMEKKVWIYQYGDKLFYIADITDVPAYLENDVKVVLFPYTSRTELLPIERQVHGYDHIRKFYFDENVITEGVYTYMISEVEIPSEYPVTYISTGIYDYTEDNWIMDCMFSMSDWREYREK